MRSSRERAIRADNEKYKESMASMKKERDQCAQEAASISKGLADIESVYNEETYDVVLSAEAAQMDRLISIVEMNSLKACSALEDVNGVLQRLAKDEMEDRRSDNDATADDDFMSPQDTENVQKAMRAKAELAATKLRDIFVKANAQYNHVLANFAAQDHTEDILEQHPPARDTENDQRQAALVAMLQKKMKEMKKELEISEGQCRSLIVQRTHDMKKAAEEKVRFERESQKLLMKLQLSESKKRFHEQIGRDDNHYVNVISPMEFEEIKRECEELTSSIAALNEEVKQKDLSILQLTQDVATAQYNLQSSEHAKVKLTAKVEELQKKENLSQERMAEIIDQCDTKMKAMDARVEEELRDARYKLKELSTLQKEKERLTKAVAAMEEKEKSVRAQSQEFMKQLSDARARIASLEEQITDQENEYARGLEDFQSKREMESTKEIERVMKELAEVEKENASLKESLETVGGKYSQQIIDMAKRSELDKQRLKDKDANIANLMMRLGQYVSDIELPVPEETNEQAGPGVEEDDSNTVTFDSSGVEIREVSVVDTAQLEALEKKHQAEIQQWEKRHAVLEKAYESLNEAITALRAFPSAPSAAATASAKESSEFGDTDKRSAGDNIRDVAEAEKSPEKPMLQVSQKPLTKSKSKEKISRASSGSAPTGSTDSASTPVIVSESAPKAIKVVSISCQTDPTPSEGTIDSIHHSTEAEVLAKPDLTSALIQTDPVELVADDRSERKMSGDNHKDSVRYVAATVETSPKSNQSSVEIREIPLDSSYQSAAQETSASKVSERSSIASLSQIDDTVRANSSVTPLTDKQVVEMIRSIVEREVKVNSVVENAPLKEAFGAAKGIDESDDDNSYVDNVISFLVDKMRPSRSNPVRKAAIAGDFASVEEQIINAMNVLTQGVTNYHTTLLRKKVAVTTVDNADSDDDYDRPIRGDSLYLDEDEESGFVINIDSRSSDPDGHDEKSNKQCDAVTVDSDSISPDELGMNSAPKPTNLLSQQKSSKKGAKKSAEDGSFGSSRHFTGEDGDTDKDVTIPSTTAVSEPKKNDNKYNLDVDDDESVEVEMVRRISHLDELDSVDRGDKLKAAELEIARLNAELVELRLSHESLYEQLQRALAKNKGDDSNSEIDRVGSSALSEVSEHSGRVSKVGFDASKFLAMASRDSHDVKKKSRAEVLLEQTRAPAIDRSEAKSPTQMMAQASERSVLTRLPDKDDDEISALEDDLSEFETMNRSPSLDLALAEGGGEGSVITKERKRIEELLSQEDAQAFGMIKSENFDRLRDGPFGGNDIVHLTRLEYYYKQLTEDIDVGSSDNSTVNSRTRGVVGSKLSSLSPTRKRVSGKTKIQAAAARVEVEAQRLLIVEKYPVKDLVRFLTVTENTLIKLSTFGVWKRMQHAAAGGLFHDILVVHRDNLNRCITDAGGYSQAMLNVQIENKLDSDTAFWPDFFRVKVLEYYRKELFSLDKLHHKEVDTLNAEIDKLRADLQEEKDCVIAERAWALKEISAMSVHLKRRLTMSRGSSVFQDMDMKDIAESLPDDLDDELGTPSQGISFRDRFSGQFSGEFEVPSPSAQDSVATSSDRTSPTPEDGSITPKIRKKVGFADNSTGQVRLYEENSAFYLKAKEIHRSLKAKSFFKKIVNSRMMFSSFQKRKESTDEFEEQLKADATKVEVDAENVSTSEAIVSTVDDVRPMRPSQMLALAAFGIKSNSLASVGETSETHSDEEEGEENRHVAEVEGSQAEPPVQEDSEMRSGSEEEEEEEEEESNDESASEMPKREFKTKIKPLVRQGSRKIERIVIDITKLQLQLQDIAIAVYKNKSEGAVLLAQSLSSVLFNWERVDTTLITLDACLSLCRPDTEDTNCIQSLKNFAKSKSCNMQLSDLMRARDALLDCVQYYEREGRIMPTRQTSTILGSDDENDSLDRPSPPGTPDKSRARGGTFRLDGGGTCGNCGARISLSDIGNPPSSQQSPKGGGKILFASTPSPSDGTSQRTQRAHSQPNSPTVKKKSIEFVVKKKKSMPIEKPVVEESVKIVDHKSCQTESNEDVVVSFQSVEDVAPMISMPNQSEKNVLPSAMSDTMLVKLEEDIWDVITPTTSIVDAPFSQYGVEISPGVRMVSNYIKKPMEPIINPEDPDLPPINEGETEIVYLPHGVVLVRKRKSFTPLFKGIVEWTDWDSLSMPKPDFPEDIIAVEIPSVLDIAPNVQLFAGGYLNYSIELPVNVWLLSLYRESDSGGQATYFGELDSMIPAGFIMVRLSESLVVSKRLAERLPVGVVLVEINPHKLVQLNGRYATLPEGLMLSPGIMLASSECAPPPQKEVVYFSFNKTKDAESEDMISVSAVEEEVPPLISKVSTNDDESSKKEEAKLIPLLLPPGILSVYVDESAEWPSFLTKLKLEGEPVEEPVDDVDVSANTDANVYLMKSSLVILKTPYGVTLPPGGVLVKRPRSMNGILRPLPPGLVLCPPSLIPERLVLKNGVELALLKPIYEVPAGAKITADAVVYQRPVGMKIPPNSALVRRSPICTVPRGVTVGALPDVPFGVYLPNEVELWVFPDGLRLPVNTELVEGVSIVDTPPFPGGQVLQPGVLFIKRQHWAMNTALPPGLERALKQHLPTGCLLPAGVEAVFIRPRYELPAGVQLQPGTILAKDIQLPPGSEILTNVEVVEWPQGMFIPPNIELVRRIDRDAGLPSEVVVVQDSADEFKTIDTTRVITTPPRGCFFIRLPNRVHLPSIYDLVDRIMVMPLCPPGAVNAADLESLRKYLPENVIAVKKVPPSRNISRPFSPLGNTPLPPELTPYPSSLIPKNVHLPVGVELMYVHTYLDLPEGVILKGGLTVKNRLNSLSIPPELIPVQSENRDAKQVPSEVHIYPCQDLSPGHFGVLPVSINDIVVSWGRDLEPMNPATPPMDMKKLPESYFLIDLDKVGEHLERLPPFLEIVHNAASLPAGILLPAHTVVVRLKPRIILPFGIRVFDIDSLPSNMQLCPGEPLNETNVEINFYPIGRATDSSTTHVIKLDNQNIKEDVMNLHTRAHLTLQDRLAKWFRSYRLSTIGVSVKGHGGYIQGTIPAPTIMISSLSEIMRVPSRSVISRGLSSRGSRAPLSKNSSRTLSEKDAKEAFDAGHEEDLQMANEQIEKLNDILEESYKEVRALKRSVESGAKELELSRAKYERLETFRDNLMEELDRVRGSLDTIKAQEKKDDTANRVKIMDLTAQTRNQAFVMSEYEDKIKALEDRIVHMKANGGKSKNDLRRDAIKKEQEINAAREEALNEYRQLLKICARTAYQLVLAIVSAAEKDRHLLAYSVTQKMGHNFAQHDAIDDMSQLTMEDDDDMSLLSTHNIDDGPSGAGSVVNRGSVKSASHSVSFNLESESGMNYSKSMPAFRAGTAKSSKGGGMSIASGSSMGGRSTADSTMTGRGHKRSVKPIVRNYQRLPAVAVDESQAYAIASCLVDKSHDELASQTSRRSLKSEGGSRLSSSVGKSNIFLTTTGTTKTYNRRAGTSDSKSRSNTILDSVREFPNDSIISLELVEPEVLKSSDYFQSAQTDLTVADILPEKFIIDLESTFQLASKAIHRTDDSSLGSVQSTTKVYVVDTAMADAFASEWLKKAVALSVNAIANTLGNYVSAFHLIESEIDSHIAERKRLHKKLKHAEGKYEDLVSTSDVPLEQRMQYRLDELNKSLVQMYSHAHNVRNMSHQSFLEALQAKCQEISDLLEQERRLELSVIVVRKKALAEENRLKRGEFEEKERIAITHYVDALRKRAVVLSNRAETVKSCCQDISASVKTELEAFEGAVQNVMPPRIITKVLNWGISHSEKAIRDPQVPTSTGAVGAPPKPIKPAIQQQQSLPLLRPSPTLPGIIIGKTDSSGNSIAGGEKKVPVVKPDPFNRYFISGSGSGPRKDNRKSSDAPAKM